MKEENTKQNPLRKFFSYGKSNKITGEEFKELRRLLESKRRQIGKQAKAFISHAFS